MKIRFDFETRSRADLKEVGAAVYSEDPSTCVLLMAIETPNGVEVFGLYPDASIPAFVVDVINQGAVFHAWNSFFDEAIWTNVLYKRHGWPLPRFFDDAALARNHNLPFKLERCAKALNLPDGKDKNGERLISFFCKPVTTGRHAGEFRDPAFFPVEWDSFKAYCKQDVAVQLDIVRRLPDLLPEDRAFWEVTRDSNRAGVGLDLPLISQLQRMVAAGEERLDRKIRKLTLGALDAHKVAHDHRALSTHLALPSVAKLAVKERMTGELRRGERFLLEARQSLGQSSTSKLAKMSMQACADGTAKGIIRYHGADTGRDTSLGINLMNMPRGGKAFKPEQLIAKAQEGAVEAFLALAKGDASGAAAACLRGCLVPRQKAFLQCDYAGIEPRVAAWYAGEGWMTDCFVAFDAGIGPDLYKTAASKLFSVDVSKVSVDQRQSGKVLELQCLYRSGATTLARQAKDVYGVVLSEEVARHYVNLYRATHPAIVSTWSYLEDAAKAAIRNPKIVFLCGKVKFRFDAGNLYLRLASGRKVVFNQAKIEPVTTEYGVRECITHFAEVGQGAAKKWEWVITHGGVLFNSVVQGSSNCIMRAACVRLAKRGLQVVLRVYDELVVDGDPERFDEFKACMLESPAWAPDLHLAGSGWVGDRYRKE